MSQPRRPGLDPSFGSRTAAVEVDRPKNPRYAPFSVGPSYAHHGRQKESWLQIVWKEMTGYSISRAPHKRRRPQIDVHPHRSRQTAQQHSPDHTRWGESTGRHHRRGRRRHACEGDRTVHGDHPDMIATADPSTTVITRPPLGGGSRSSPWRGAPAQPQLQ